MDALYDLAETPGIIGMAYWQGYDAAVAAMGAGVGLTIDKTEREPVPENNLAAYAMARSEAVMEFRSMLIDLLGKLEGMD